MLDFDQLEAVVESIGRVENYNRSSYTVDTYAAAQTDHTGVKSHLDSLADPSAPVEKPKSISFKALQSRINSLGI